MKQFKTDEEQFRKFIIKAERFIKNIPSEYIYDDLNIEGALLLNNIDNYKFELGMLKHPDAVKSTMWLEQEIPFSEKT